MIFAYIALSLALIVSNDIPTSPPVTLLLSPLVSSTWLQCNQGA